VAFCSLTATTSYYKAAAPIWKSTPVNRTFQLESQGVWHRLSRYTADV
jgi:hypothetical protein